MKNRAPRSRWALLLATVLLLPAASPDPAEPGQAAQASADTATGCEAKGEYSFRCGFAAPEDLVAIPGTSWLIVSGYDRRAGQGRLWLLDRAGGSPVAAEVDLATPSADGCAAPPDLRRFLPHGLALASVEGRPRLLVVNHGDREAIEIFDVVVTGNQPRLTWAGCAPAPDGVAFNSVTGLPDAGIVATSQFNIEDRDWNTRRKRLVAGEPSGDIYRYRPGQAFERLALPRIAGPNGIEVSRDGRYLIVSGWATRELVRLDLADPGAIERLRVPFLPDNLRYASDGSLVVAGQGGTVDQAFACHLDAAKPKYCEGRWGAVAIDPATMAIRRHWAGDATSAGFGDISTVLLAGGRMWLGSISGDRIAVLDARAGDH